MMLLKNNLVDKVLSKIAQKKRAMRLAFLSGDREGKIRSSYKTEIFLRFFSRCHTFATKLSICVYFCICIKNKNVVFMRDSACLRA
jgi:hypothetical protein